MYCASRAVMLVAVGESPPSFSWLRDIVKDVVETTTWKLWIHLGSGCANRVAVAQMLRYTEQWTSHSTMTARTCPLIQVKIWWGAPARTTEERCDWCNVCDGCVTRSGRCSVCSRVSGRETGVRGPNSLVTRFIVLFVGTETTINSLINLLRVGAAVYLYTSSLHVAFMHQLPDSHLDGQRLRSLVFLEVFIHFCFYYGVVLCNSYVWNPRPADDIWPDVQYISF